MPLQDVAQRVVIVRVRDPVAQRLHGGCGLDGL
jgi:hypothetical protein